MLRLPQFRGKFFSHWTTHAAMRTHVPKLGFNKFLTPTTNKSHFFCSALELPEQKNIGLKLPVLEDLYTHLLSNNKKPVPDFSRTLFICGQHLLNTTLSLFELYLRLGAKPENIYVVGKSYSNSPEVIKQVQEMGIQYEPNLPQDEIGEFEPLYEADINRMLDKVITRLQKEKSNPSIDFIITPDDGGHVLTGIRRNIRLRNLCKYIVGIEQTSSGIASSRRLAYPVIELATSAIKRWIEPPMIATQVAKNVVNKLLESLLPEELSKPSEHDAPLSVLPLIQSFTKKEKPTCTIVGAGYIGIAVLEKLAECGIKDFIIVDSHYEKAKNWAITFQKQHKPFTITAIKFLSTAIAQADIIVGCTGTDITEDSAVIEVLEQRRSPAIMFSCGSKDKEGATLLRHLQTKYIPRGEPGFKPLDNLIFLNNLKMKILLLRGLFPLNFNNTPQSVPPEQIQVIRGLKAMATAQAYYMLLDAQKNNFLPVDNYRLDAEAQLLTIALFEKHEPKVIESYPPEIRKKIKDKNAIASESGGVEYQPDTRLTNTITRRPQ